MASVRYYRLSNGLMIPMIISNELVNDYPIPKTSTIVVSNNNLSSYGETLKNYLPEVIVDIYYNANGGYNETSLVGASKIVLPNMVSLNYTDTSHNYVENNIIVENTSNRKVTIEISPYANNAFYDIQVKIDPNGTYYLINKTIGIVGVLSASSTNSAFKFALLCANDTLTNFRLLNFSHSNSNTTIVCDAADLNNVVVSRYSGFFSPLPYYEFPTDPYSGAGDSTTGGGDGTFDGTSDPVPVPSLPSVGAQDSGFITLFAPTSQQMKDLAHYMWVNPLFDLTAFKKLFADPMDCILGLSVVPVSIPTSGTKNVNIGNLVTSVSMNVASQQYIEVDCGTVNMSDRFFGSYLDYEPYTKISIFLPYCGTHQLNADDIIGKTIGVVYHIDILTGSCIAFVKCGDSVLYEFNGACGSNIPVNSLNFASTIENAIRIAVNIGTTVATAGASAPITAATEGAQTIRNAANVGRAISLAGSTAEGALSMKPNVSRSGALGGGVGILGHQIPYLIITRPRLCKPANQDFFEGYPSFIQTTIGDLIGKGFTSFTDVIIASQYLTDSEESELEQILQGGVYL